MITDMNSAILEPFVEIMGIVSTHFIKYLVVVVINLWPSNDVGDICPMRSKSHQENGHKVCIDYKAWEGWTKRWACCWHLVHFLT